MADGVLCNQVTFSWASILGGLGRFHTTAEAVKPKTGHSRRTVFLPRDATQTTSPSVMAAFVIR
jgi:hypothetical protein